MLTMVVRTEVLRANGLWPSEYQSGNDLLALARILLSGRIGLINERCATLTIHNSTVSTGLGLDHGFSEIQEVMELIFDILTRVIPDEAQRRELQNLTAHYVAKKLFDFLVLYRRQGAALRDVTRQLRNWRKQSRQCTLFNLVAALRFKTFMLLLLPEPITKLLLSFRHAVQARYIL